MITAMRYSSPLLSGLAVCLVASVSLAAARPAPISPVAGEIRERVLVQLPKGQQVLPLGSQLLRSPEQLRAFYQGRGFEPAWREPGGEPAPLAAQLLDMVSTADAEGLHPGDYHAGRIAELLEDPQARGDTAPAWVELDLLLSDAFLSYARHLQYGRVPPQGAFRQFETRARDVDVTALLAKALRERRLQESLTVIAPRHAGYWALRQALADYRELARYPEPPPLASDVTLRLGDSGPDVALLRRLLSVNGDLTTEDIVNMEFDKDVEAAVRRFQSRHALEVDGVVGPRTEAQLNVPVKTRLRQIEMNLERWRWLPVALDERYVMVNIAGFRLDVFERGQPVLGMRTIVGKDLQETPVLVGSLSQVVLNPYWSVPHTIASKELLQKIRDDKKYLERESMRVYAGVDGTVREVDPNIVPWQRFSEKSFPVTLRQDPGPRNPLGRIKFVFPNRHDVYLHDTSNPELFGAGVRGFSHGCIRVEKPLDLASYLLQSSPSWSRDKIGAAIGTKATQTIPLPRHVPIYILYWTAWVDEASRMHFGDDIYGQDRQLEQLLYSPALTFAHQ
jgi:murein L,D-transpeptidase YcbB/YkuD